MRFSVNVLGLNKSEVRTSDGTVVFFSYKTPVAAVHRGVLYRTNQKYSPTTSKHVSRWDPPYYRETKSVSEEFLATLFARAILSEHHAGLKMALETVRTAVAPYMGQLPDIVMNKITESLNLLSTETENK